MKVLQTHSDSSGTSLCRISIRGKSYYTSSYIRP